MKILKRKTLTLEDTKGLDGLAVKSDALRALRAPLLDAFDVYKSNVYYGVVTENAEQHDCIISWYRDLCDLKESAIDNPPDGIKQYVRKSAKR